MSSLTSKQLKEKILEDIPINLSKEFLFHLWKKKKPSENYHRSYYAKFPDGTDCTIEYNFLREVVKIELHFIEDSRDYCILIQRGSIVKEREIQSNRPVSLFKRMQKYKDYFSYLVDEQILKTIGGNYNISEKSNHPQATSDFSFLQLNKKIFIKPKRIFDQIKIYFYQKEKKQKQLKGLQKFYNRMLGDLFDLFVVILFFYFFWIGKLSSYALSFLCILYSIMSGFFDSFIRRRNPLLLKSLLFFFAGVLIIWFQYQLFEWGIYEPANEKLWILYDFFKQKFGI